MLAKIQRGAQRMLQDPNVTYVVVGLAVLNLIGFVAARRTIAVLFFAVVALIAYQYVRNPAMIALAAMILTNLLVGSGRLIEGMSDKDDNQDKDQAEDQEDDVGGTEKYKDSGNNGIKGAVASKPAAAKGGNKKAKRNAARGSRLDGSPTDEDEPRIDYGRTVEGAYDNLDKILGSDSIRQLSSDTQKLMSNQKKLFDTMQTMAPALESAKSMLKTLDLGGMGMGSNSDGLGKLLKSIQST